MNINAINNFSKPVNEPVKDYRPGSPEKLQLKQQIKKMLGEQIEIPLRIGGKLVKTSRGSRGHPYFRPIVQGPGCFIGQKYGFTFLTPFIRADS
jgi:hypothetical protein